MDKLLPYFSFNGRVNRQRYWLTTLAIVAFYLIGLVASAAFMALPVIAGLIGLPVVVITFWTGLALASRRLHDRNKSAWWLVAMYLPLLLLSGLGGAMSAMDEGAGAFFSVLSLPFSIWILVELGCLRGTIGPNRFGDDPLNPTPAEVFA